MVRQQPAPHPASVQERFLRSKLVSSSQGTPIDRCKSKEDSRLPVSSITQVEMGAKQKVSRQTQIDGQTNSQTTSYEKDS